MIATESYLSTMLGCGVYELGSIYNCSVEQIKKACEDVRWTREGALVIASTGGTSHIYGLEEKLTEVGFKQVAEAPNMRHEYKHENPRHLVKLWVCDVSNWPEPKGY